MPSKRILLVDDVKLFLQLGKSMMARKDFIVETAQSGIEAIDKAFRSPPDIIFLDFFMPDLNGDEVCRKLKNDPRTEGVPVVMLSFDGKPEVLSPCFAAGCDDFVTKPIRAEILLMVGGPGENGIRQTAYLIRRQLEFAGLSEEEARQAENHFIQIYYAKSFEQYIKHAKPLYDNPLQRKLGFVSALWDETNWKPHSPDNEGFYDPMDVIEKITIPALVFFGEKDTQ